jgi:hypothetical protein
MTNLSLGQVIGNIMKNVCYLHHNVFLIFEQRITIIILIQLRKEKFVCMYLYRAINNYLDQRKL